MQDIDFLPAEYRQKHASRQTKPWRVVVVIAVVGLLATATLGLRSRRQAAEDHLALVEPQYDLVVQQSNALAGLQTQLQTAAAKAELITYLRHPWPKSQILSALLTPLPEQITLRELQVFSESRPKSRTSQSRSAAEANAQAAADANLGPAGLDLKDFREKFDDSQTVVLLEGVTTDSAALHKYLGKLDEVDLFSNVELRSVESIDGGPSEDGIAGGGTMQFQAAAIVRPGYGQPGGPEDPGGAAHASGIQNAARKHGQSNAQPAAGAERNAPENARRTWPEREDG